MRRIHMYRSAATSRKTVSRNRFALGRMSGILAALVLFVLACSDGGTGPDTRAASVAVSPATRAMVLGEVTTLHAVVKNRAGAPLEGREVSWRSSDPEVADVSADGEVEAIGVGRATITATSDGVNGTARIDVSARPPAAVDRVELDAQQVKLRKYESRQLVAKAYDADGNLLEGRTVTWASHTPAVATVDETGRVTARAVGLARVYAVVEERSGYADVVVDPAPVAAVVLSAAGPEMDRGEVQRLSIRLEDEQGLELTDRSIAWSSSDQSVAFVTGDGVVFALKEGPATITATSEGVSGEVALRVAAPPAFDVIYDRPLASGGAEIFLLELGQPSTPVKLNAGNVSRDPSPSPDGQRYVFAVSQLDHTTGAPMNDLFVVNVNGSGMRRLTSMPGIEHEPAWSPDGTRIAFSVVDQTGGADIWVVNADGTGLVNLTADMGEWSGEHSPSWSPDGERIAFGTTSGGIRSSIWTMRADGGDKTRLVTDLSHGVHPTWSPDGARIAFDFYGGVGRGMDVAIAPVAGGPATALILEGDQSLPEWSPDGALLAFVAPDAGGTYQVWTMRPDGTGARMRTTAGGLNPSWIDR